MDASEHVRQPLIERYFFLLFMTNQLFGFLDTSEGKLRSAKLQDQIIIW